MGLKGAQNLPIWFPKGATGSRNLFLWKESLAALAFPFTKEKVFIRGATILALQNFFFLGKGKTSAARPPVVSVE